MGRTRLRKNACRGDGGGVMVKHFVPVCGIFLHSRVIEISHGRELRACIAAVSYIACRILTV